MVMGGKGRKNSGEKFNTVVQDRNDLRLKSGRREREKWMARRRMEKKRAFLEIYRWERGGFR